MRSARMALFPLLIAERDREFLKQLTRNRDEEEKLMADVPGWKVGTWYGEPVFKTPVSRPQGPVGHHPAGPDRLYLCQGWRGARPHPDAGLQRGRQ